MKRLTIEFKNEQALIDYVQRMADADLIPDGADVYPRDPLDRFPNDFLIRSIAAGYTNGILGKTNDDTT